MVILTANLVLPAYKEKIGFRGQLLIEPKAKEPSRHQYDYDAQTVMAFLHQYGLSNHFKLNIEPNHTTLAGHPYEHDVIFSSAYVSLVKRMNGICEALINYEVTF